MLFTEKLQDYIFFFFNTSHLSIIEQMKKINLLLINLKPLNVLSLHKGEISSVKIK